VNGYSSVCHFDEKNWTCYEKELAGTNPNQILFAPDGAIWFISDEAWIRYQPEPREK